MIVKINKSANLSHTLGYVFQEYKGRFGAPDVIDQTCISRDAEGAYAELKGAIDRHDGVKQPVFHGIISIPSYDDLSREQWVDVVREYTEGMGFGDAPYVAIRHHDTDHAHVHIVASRVDIHGRLVSDSHDYYRSQAIARELEIKHELSRVRSSWEVPDRERSVSQREYHVTQRTGVTSEREQMRQTIERALTQVESAPELAQKLAEHDVTLVPKLTQDERVVGVYFEHGGMKIPGSKVDRSFSWPKLSERLDYDHARDFARLTRVPEHDSISRATAPPINPERLSRDVPPGPEPGIQRTPSVSPDDRTSEHTRRPEVTRSTAAKDPRTPTRDASRTREIIRHKRPEREQDRGRKDARELTRGTRTLERKRGTMEGPERTRGPAKTVETEHTKMASRTPQAPSSVTPAGPENEREQLRERARQKMAKALEGAQWKRGWEAWAKSLRAQGVEPLPKGTQAEPERVRGMYFEANGQTIPGSQVARGYSIKALEFRLGPYQPARDARAFTQVEVPGRGREPMPHHEVAGPAHSPSTPTPTTPHEPNTPTIEPATPTRQDLPSYEALVARLEATGAVVGHDPERFEGMWKGTYADSRGQLYGALAFGKEVALVRLEPGTTYVEVTRVEGRQPAGSRTSLEPDQVPRDARLVWHMLGSSRALVHDPEGPSLRMRDQSQSQGMARPGGQRSGQERGSEVTRTPPTRGSMEGPSRERGPGEHVHDDGARGSRRGVEANHERADGAVDLTALEWIEAARRQGANARMIEVNRAVRGALEPHNLELKDGSYHVLRTPNDALVLVKACEELEQIRGTRQAQKIQVRERKDGSFALKIRGRERDMDR